MQESEEQTATRSFENQASGALHSTAKQAADGVDLRFVFITRLSVLLSTTLAVLIAPAISRATSSGSAPCVTGAYSLVVVYA